MHFPFYLIGAADEQNFAVDEVKQFSSVFMISSRSQLTEVLALDKSALGRKETRPRFFGDEIWKFQRSLRRLEFFECRPKFSFDRLFVYPIEKYRFHKLSLACGFTIPCHVFGPGLAIVHRGTIVINSKARVGSFCRIHADVNIGASGGDGYAVPRLGDYVYIGPGAKIFGKITVPDRCVIGANAVVNHSFTEAGITIAGVPAVKISERSSKTVIRAA